MAKTMCDRVVECLIDWGVDTVFGLPGDGINGFMEALRKAREQIRFVHVRHEEVAAMAACGYSKFARRLERDQIELQTLRRKAVVHGHCHHRAVLDFVAIHALGALTATAALALAG
jgi:hypothetical protein